ncbi:uncharacterized protein KY384_004586 [Bacidia gigantensis]|uniref:uncharacterized protein n=1 Tax=Bacidia gigantensis TaxID=2732470 RepID=UPI001D044647|nr:uncharacterized protein KY384_004586 [Bacidia gigantensis]KAG8531228.1 hypothetical protein KY384_004586 [Bacidia gigantensis]
MPMSAWRLRRYLAPTSGLGDEVGTASMETSSRPEVMENIHEDGGPDRQLGNNRSLIEDDTAKSARKINFLSGIALMIGLQIGSGIFSTPATVITLIPFKTGAISIWAGAGLLVWTGAASFAELGVRYPGNGGILQYLRHSFGPKPGAAGDMVAFVFSWIWIAIVKPCSMMALGMLTISGIFVQNGLRDEGNVPSYSPTSTTRAYPDFHSVDERGQHKSRFTPLTVADALFAALFAFGGWESVGFVAGEIVDPEKTIPKILNGAMSMTTSLFTLTVVAFYSVVPLDTLKETNAVAAVRKTLLRSCLPWVR